MDPFHHSQNEHNFHKPKESRIHSNTFLMVVTVICCSLATLALASLLSDLVFGEDAPLTVFYDYSQLRPGDHIRLELTEHSMTMLTVEEDGITVVECNSDYQHCRISWDRFLSWDDLAGYSYEMECITRYED